MSEYTGFYFKPMPGELVTAVIRADNEMLSGICGTVIDSKNKPVSDVFVMLFRTADDLLEHNLICSAFTDTYGRFAFGPLESGVLYNVKLYKNSAKIRELEIVSE